MSGFEPVAGDAAEAVERDAAARPLVSLEELDRLAELDVDAHPDVYQRIHTDLQGALASIDDA